MSKVNQRPQSIKTAPTLMEGLVQIQERMATLEARVDRIEIHQRTQHSLASDDKHNLNSEYGVFAQYHGGHVEVYNDRGDTDAK